MEIPTSETEIRARLCQVAVSQRHASRQLRELNSLWEDLVAERIQLEAALRTFELHRTDVARGVRDDP